MKKFLIILANLFFIYYLFEAFFGIVEVPYLIIMGKELPFSQPIFFINVFLCIIFYLISGFFNVFPKRYFIPFTLFPIVSFLIILTLIMPYMLKSGFSPQELDIAAFYKDHIFISITMVVLKIIQLYVAIWFIKKIRRKALDVGQSIISIKGIFLFILFNIFVILPLFFVYGHTNIVVIADNIAGDYMRSDPTTLYSVQKTFKKDSDEVYLIGMIHIGGSDFYNTLSKEFKGKDSVVLAEGVTDNEGLLKSKVSYEKVSKALGIGAQEKDFKLDTKETDIIRADLDTSEFNKETIDFINNVFGNINKGNLKDLLKAEENNKLMVKVSQDLIEKRNKKLFKTLKENLDEYNLFFIPWGAFHLEEFENMIVEDGFDQIGEKKVRKVVSYLDIYQNLMKKLKGKSKKQ